MEVRQLALHALRIRNNMIEKTVAGLKPEDANSREFERWETAMDLLGQQFQQIQDLILNE